MRLNVAAQGTCNEHTTGKRREINYMCMGNSNSLFEFKDWENDQVIFARNYTKPTFVVEEIAISLQYMLRL